jgi:hypothetical protein
VRTPSIPETTDVSNPSSSAVLRRAEDQARDMSAQDRMLQTRRSAEGQNENPPKMQLLYDSELGDFARLRGAAADGLLPGLHGHRSKDFVTTKAEQVTNDTQRGAIRMALVPEGGCWWSSPWRRGR